MYESLGSVVRSPVAPTPSSFGGALHDTCHVFFLRSLSERHAVSDRPQSAALGRRDLGGPQEGSGSVRGH